MKTFIALLLIVFLTISCNKDKEQKPQTTSTQTTSNSWFSIGDSIFKPTSITYSSDSNYWILNVDYDPWKTRPVKYSDHASIYFPGTLPTNSSRIYSLKSSYQSLSSDTACIIMSDSYADRLPVETIKFYSFAGQLTLSVINGKIHAVFNDVDAKADTSNSTVKIAGDITYP
jgi:hypothetical protein